jgi:hypothetical protein
MKIPGQFVHNHIFSIAGKVLDEQDIVSRDGDCSNSSQNLSEVRHSSLSRQQNLFDEEDDNGSSDHSFGMLPVRPQMTENQKKSPMAGKQKFQLFPIQLMRER